MRVVFQGVGAFVGRIDSEYRCAFWIDHPVHHNFDPVLLVPIDLWRTPARAAAGAIDWDEVVVDDHRSANAGGLTQIGPLWPGWPGPQTVGAVYLAETFVRRMRASIQPGDLPPGFENEARPYEFQTAVYANSGRATRRYYGFHGEIQRENGNNAQVAVWHAGKSRISAPAGTITIAFGQLDQVDAHATQGGLTEIGVGAGHAKAGAIFLSEQQSKVITLDYPKVPRASQA